jgi:hypothetical protein
MEPWRSAIFATTAKGRDDALIDNLLLVPSYLHELDNMRSKFIMYVAADIRRLYDRTLSLKRSLDDWLALYLHRDYKDSGKYLPVDSSESHKTTYYLWMHQDEISKDELYHFTTGMILTLSILRDTCEPSMAPGLYGDQIMQHSGFILTIMRHIDQQWGGNNGPITVVLPLKVIATLSPDSRQREYARSRLANWDKGIGCGGYFTVLSIVTGNLYEIVGYAQALG